MASTMGSTSDRISLTSLRLAWSASPLVSMCIRNMSARTFCRALATCCPRVFVGGLPISTNPEHHEAQEGHDHRQDEVESSPCQGILTTMPWSRSRGGGWFLAILSTCTRRTSPSLRSEEHTSELQSHHDIVCRLLLEKKNKQQLHTKTKNINQNIIPKKQRQEN